MAAFEGRQLLLAPMAGVTDAVFRRLCREQGADLTFTEMVSAKGLSYANEKTRHLVELGEGESEVAVQLFGHEPTSLAEQAAWVEQELGSALVLIDINMGCPARKIVKKGDGSALMRDPERAASLVRAVKDAVRAPVTCKFRRSWDASGNYMDAANFARVLEDAGVDGITVHGRYAVQLYRGTSNRDCIRQVKEAVSVPVVGNGDVFTGADALSLMHETGCDAVMIARGAQGNPWLFAEAAALLGGKSVPPAPSYAERLAALRRHVGLMSEAGCRLAPMRKHAMWYVSGIPGAAQARDAFSTCSTVADFEKVVRKLEEVCHAA